MSGAKINNILNKAYDKIGNVLGYTFNVYRSVDYITPIQTKNYLKDVRCAFSIDENFSKMQDYTFNKFNLFTNSTTLQVGDILVNEELDKTFVLIGKDPIAYPAGIEATSTISINRAIYNATGGFGPKQEEIATNIPASVFEQASGQEKGALLQPSSMKTGHRQWAMWLYVPHNDIRINDIITDVRGNTSIITSVEYSEFGYKVKSLSTKVGA